ncbi:MAG: transporter ATP-binding protein [Bacteroidetes bacterium]|jgi:phospholipid/cholesterol/gamma-HCH transport system ATP-binding protein|nr:transporter ATP-binding protein [Bacteroidota bacterium]
MNSSSAEIFTLHQSPQKNTESIIEINNLKISFGQQEVLKDVSFNLHKGENLVVLGKSGSGKSVLIKCITKLLQPDYGKITVLGEDVNSLEGKKLAELRKKIGFLFQSGALYDSMTVKENLEFPLSRMEQKFTKEEKYEKVISVLENVGLKDAVNKMPSELSGGMRKRIALARTLIVDPVIMLYDEPTTGLDPLTSREISKLINEVQQKYHTSSVIITHDMDCAKETGDRALILKDGTILAEGKLEELENSDDAWIKAFFGKT